MCEVLYTTEPKLSDLKGLKSNILETRKPTTGCAKSETGLIVKELGVGVTPRWSLLTMSVRLKVHYLLLIMLEYGYLVYAFLGLVSQSAL